MGSHDSYHLWCWGDEMEGQTQEEAVLVHGMFNFH